MISEYFSLSIMTRSEIMGVGCKAYPLTLEVGCKSNPLFLALQLTLQYDREEYAILADDPLGVIFVKGRILRGLIYYPCCNIKA